MIERIYNEILETSVKNCVDNIFELREKIIERFTKIKTTKYLLKNKFRKILARKIYLKRKKCINSYKNIIETYKIRFRIREGNLGYF